MFVGREKELQDLHNFYENTETEILVLYGQTGMGKTALLKQFLEGKEHFYYNGVSCSSLQQRSFIAHYLTDIGFSFSQIPEYEDILFTITQNIEDKAIIVLDEFQYLGRTEDTFFQALKNYIEKRTQRKLLLILVSSAIAWVQSLKEENSPLTKEAVFYKLEELTYGDFQQFFPNFAKKESITAYSILGGIPGLWPYFQDKLSLRENIEGTFLKADHPLSSLAQQLVAEEIRETAVYNTILCAMAQGKEKLNDLYHVTGFSRAKISVYLKNLIHLDLVEKVTCIDTGEKEHRKKGSYRICHSYLRFYYRYIFFNHHRQNTLNSALFYDKIIADDLPNFSKDSFKKVCREFIEGENKKGRLPGDFTFLGTWTGKAGDIDFVYEDLQEEEILAGICNWEKKMMTLEDYQRFVKCKEQANIIPDFEILCSAGNFDNHLRELSKKNPRIALVYLEQMG